MLDTKAYLEGTIVGRRHGVFKAPDGSKEEPYGVVQMTGRDKEAAKMFEVTLAPGFDIDRYVPGTKAKIEVTIGASKDGRRLYFREVPAADTTAKTTSTSNRTDDLRTAPKL